MLDELARIARYALRLRALLREALDYARGDDGVCRGCGCLGNDHGEDCVFGRIERELNRRARRERDG